MQSKANKGEVLLCPRCEAVEACSHSFITSALHGGTGSTSSPGRYTRGESPGYPLYWRLGKSRSANTIPSTMNQRAIHIGVLLQYSLHARRDEDNDCALGTWKIRQLEQKSQILMQKLRKEKNVKNVVWKTSLHPAQKRPASCRSLGVRARWQNNFWSPSPDNCFPASPDNVKAYKLSKQNKVRSSAARANPQCRQALTETKLQRSLSCCTLGPWRLFQLQEF